MIYITGDTHGDFDRIGRFCHRMGTNRDDVIIILGDAGLNFHGTYNDVLRKSYVASLPVTIFAIHGNHEMRPATIPSYHLTEWRGGKVYVEDAYPNILFGKDGEFFDFDGMRAIVIGGAYSVDKFYRLANGYGWWPDEQPSDEIKREVEARLEAAGWNIDLVLSHTAPIKYEPTEVFLPFIDQSEVDKSTEIWLGEIEDKLEYKRWYCGHYHTEKAIDRIRFMYHDMIQLTDGERKAQPVDVP